MSFRARLWSQAQATVWTLCREDTESRQEEPESAVKTTPATDPTLTQEPKSSVVPQVAEAARTEMLAQSYIRQALLRNLRAKQLMRKNARLPNQWYNAGNRSALSRLSFLETIVQMV